MKFCSSITWDAEGTCASVFFGTCAVTTNIVIFIDDKNDPLIRAPLMVFEIFGEENVWIGGICSQCVEGIGAFRSDECVHVTVISNKFLMISIPTQKCAI